MSDHSEQITQPQAETRPATTSSVAQRWFWVPLLLGMALIFAGAWVLQAQEPDLFLTIFGSIEEIDLDQSRIDAALPVPNPKLSMSQTFIPRHDGLTEIEITLVRYGEKPANEEEFLRLQLANSRGILIAEETLQTAPIEHNQVARLQFDPQPDSAGETYQLSLLGSENNPISVWGYSEDVYADGQLILRPDEIGDTLPPIPARDIRFQTRYLLTWGEALRTLLKNLLFEGGLVLLTLLLLPLPGVLALLVWRLQQVSAEPGATLEQTGGAAWLLRPWDPLAWFGVALGLGIALWPLIWQWMTSIGGQITSVLLWVVLVGGWSAAALLWSHLNNKLNQEKAAKETSANPEKTNLIVQPWSDFHWVLLGVLILGFAVRFLAIRDMTFPLWVDSSRHALITAVMANSGKTISSYAPFLPVERFPYHYGFHTLSASIQLLSNWELPRLLLYLGQTLNALVPLAIFAAIWLLTRQRSAGLVGALLVALPFFFPAYYATWGRFTQLTAVLVLPILLAFTWLLIRDGQVGKRLWWLVGVLAAGLFLIHFRVFLYYLPFVLIVWLISLGRNGRSLFAAAGFSAVLALPRLMELLRATNPVRRIGRTITNYNTFPLNYYNTGWEPQFIWLAGACLLFALLALLFRKRWAILPLALAMWVGALFLLLAGDYLGLPETSLVNLNSMYILLFIPLAMVLGVVAGQIWAWLQRRHWSYRSVGYLLVGGLVAGVLLLGVRQQISVLNPQTVLALPEDVPALRWVESELPDDALIAVNSWKWLGETWAVSDGGGWIVPTTGLITTTPPIDYTYNADYFRDIREFNAGAQEISDWSTPESAAWLREQGVTHIFVGKRGGFFDPAKLKDNSELEELYAYNGVFVFALK